jgi:zinc protease
MAGFKDTLVPAKRLQDVKSHLRYSFALSLDNSEAIAGGLAPYLSLARTPETLNRLYDTFAAVTPEDIRAAARKYFNEDGRTVVTLTGAGAK